MTNIHLLVVGVGKVVMRDAASRLAFSARKSRWFNSIAMEDSESLTTVHKDFFENQKDFILDARNARGFGHYLWKPYLINYWLKKIKNGDILVYLDAGCHLNWKNLNAKRRFLNYLEITQQGSALAMQLKDNSFGIADLREISWSRQDLIKYLVARKRDLQSNQIQSGIIFLKKNPKTLAYSQDWYSTAIYNNCLFLDDEKIPSDNSELIESRWEQSIHSLLFKRHQFPTILDETTFGEVWPPDWRVLGREFPIWAMRNRSGVMPYSLRIRDFKYRLNRFLDR